MCWEVSLTSSTSFSREWFKYLLGYSSHCQLVLRWNLNMVSEPKPNFFPVVMGQICPLVMGQR
ncbi:hypothetical protein Lalb_Chr19g0127301 [Lupinus albus]|uniref:Uncharacterized protein n=1 Tax=Lupinus albus TaxID=3870 RepID=A0A6A4P0X3_LUPAL|nr:hypothetical protein Lalb_Chr19g0127301 [Lupinus albus]